MTYAIGSDHAGFALKEAIKKMLSEKGFEFEDYGCYEPVRCDYPDIAQKVGEAIVAGKHERGILVCGTGIGISIAANKVPGIRAAAVQDYFAAEHCRLHNDANIICFGERITGPGAASEMAEIFLSTDPEGGRHAERIAKISAIEEKYSK